MRSRSVSLITVLRRRLAIAVWLFALLVGSQSAFAAGCAAEGFAGAATSGEMRALAPVDDTAADGALCWHAGSGECHCACAHASGIPVSVHALTILRFGLATPIAAVPSAYTTRLSADLRPPIA